MNLSPKFFCLVSFSLALVFAGCNHTPVRSDPSLTIDPNAGDNSNHGTGNSALIIPSVPPAPPPDGGGVLTTRGSTADDLTAGRNILESIYFDFDRSIIKPAEAKKIQAAVKYLHDNPGSRLLLEGHCDWRGTAEYNIGLGDRRAAAVKQYLQKLKVPAEALDTLSKGNIGAAEKGTEEQMAKDRRVEFVVQKAGAAGAPADLQAPAATPVAP